MKLQYEGGDEFDADYSEVVDEFRYGDTLEEREEKGEVLLDKILEQRKTDGIDMKDELDSRQNYLGGGV